VDTTSISNRLTIQPLIDSNYINNNNVLFVNFIPFIAGISTLDSDFSLNIEQPSFNPLTMEISFLVTIQEMDAKDVTVNFGYLLYDASVISVGFYEGQWLIPNSIADGYIYGISFITAQNTNANRILQVVPNNRLFSANYSSSNDGAVDPNLPAINATNPVSIYPTVIKLNDNNIMSTSSASTSASASTSPPSAYSSLSTNSPPPAMDTSSTNPAITKMAASNTYQP
jgi:hypothetical protein